jgi:hypothetical protein
MKRFIPFLALTLLLASILPGGTLKGQEKSQDAIRIIIQKKIDGELQKIDTILQIQQDSLKTVWYAFNEEKMDSLRGKMHQKMALKMKVLEKEHLESIREEMRRLQPRMERLRDSLEKHRIEVVIPRLERLDSLRQHDLDIRFKRLDSLHRHMIIRMDSVGDHELDIEVDVQMNLDSILGHTHRTLRDLDSLRLPRIPELDLDKYLEASLGHAHHFMVDPYRGRENDDDRQETDIQYRDGKVLQIKTDSRGRVKKVIILGPEGETMDIKEGKDAREFMTGDGERVSISSISN